MAKVKVKGTPVYRMKVVPHRPIRDLLVIISALCMVAALVIGTYFFASSLHPSGDAASDDVTVLKQQLESANADIAALRTELAKLQVGAEVDRQAGEELRRQLLTLREEKAALERDADVLRLMISNKAKNPQGIGFGVFAVTNQPEGLQHVKLVIQKLVESEDEFSGLLGFSIIGQKDGQEATYALHELAVTTPETAIAAEIPLSFKYFQNVEADIRLPEGFVPTRVALAIKSMARNQPVVVDGQLEWPEAR